MRDRHVCLSVCTPSDRALGGTLLPTSTEGTGRKRWRFEKHRSTDRFVLVPELHPSRQKPGGLISAINEKNEIKHTYSLAKSKTTRFVLACQCNVSLYVAIF